MNKIEYFLLKNPNKFSSNTIYIYQLSKRMSMVTPSFKYGLLENLVKQMDRIIDEGLNIKNN